MKRMTRQITRRPIRSVAGAGIALAAILAASRASAQTHVTFTRDVAPILFEHCAECHRPGEIGPFSLLTYEDARPRAAAIARTTHDRSMPPWKPESGYGEFVDARRLDDKQIDLIQRWVRAGAPRGDPADEPPAPSFPVGWRLGEPDLIIRMAEPYTLAAGGRDVLRNFVLPIPVSNTRYVRGIEFRPGNNRVVHHANMRIDRTGVSRRLDAADREPGFDGFITTANFPDGHFLGWTPGQLPPLAPDDLAWRLDPGSDLVLQLHMQPTGTTEVVQAAVGLFFADRAPERAPLMLRLGRQNIDIAAGTSHYVEEDTYVLPVDLEVRAVQPHAHYRAREVRGVATRPDGTKAWLLYIKDWDFNWQDVYRYARPLELPAGTTISMQYIFDNSPANRRNPDRPPKRVRWGQNSTDEMGDLWVQVLTRTNDDRKVLQDEFGRKVMTEDAVGYETILQSEPRNARLHEAAAAIYLMLNRPDAAIAHLTDSLRIDPESFEAHYNLATALVRQQRLDEAVEHFQQALRIKPDVAAVHVNLGVVLRAQNRLDAATEHFQRALQLDPGNAAAHTNLGGALAIRHQLAGAILQYRLALQTNPDLLEALTDLAWILATSRDAGIRVPAEAVRLAERAAALTGRRNVRALETAAAAYAADGRFAEAVASQQHAVDLADAAGTGSIADQLRERLDLYRRGSPYYEP